MVKPSNRQETGIGRSLFWLTLPLLIFLSACAAPSGDEVIVFAASSLTDAFDEIAAAFEEARPGVDVVLNYGSSSQLAAQIIEGAQVDVFASANSDQLQVVAEADQLEGDAIPFAGNRLVVIVPAGNPGGVETLADLARPGVRLILAAPGVPIRDYADQSIAALAADSAFGSDFAAAVYANLVSEEDNVRQVAAKIALGEADAGIVYTSDVTPDIAADVRQIEIPDPYNVTAIYPIGQIANAAHPQLAEDFIAFVLGDEGQAILRRWGFLAAP